MACRNSPKASTVRHEDMHESDRRWRDFYDRWAPRYDWAIRIWALAAGFSYTKERWRMVSRLELRPGQRVLEVSVGTGSNLPLMAERRLLKNSPKEEHTYGQGYYL